MKRSSYYLWITILSFYVISIWGISSPKTVPYYDQVFKSIAQDKGYRIEGTIPKDNINADYSTLKDTIGELASSDKDNLPTEISSGSFFNALFSEGDKIHEIHLEAANKVISFSWCLFGISTIAVFVLIVPSRRRN